MTQLERQELKDFIITIPEIQENLININCILIGGSHSFNIEDEDSDYDIILLGSMDNNFKIKPVNFKEKKIDIFFNHNINNMWHNISALIYQYNNENIIYKKNDFTLSFSNKDLINIYNGFKNNLIFDSDNNIIEYKNHPFMIWLFLSYFYLINDSGKINFINNYKLESKDSKLFINRKTLKNIEVLTVLNQIKAFIENIINNE